MTRRLLRSVLSLLSLLIALPVAATSATLDAALAAKQAGRHAEAAAMLQQLSAAQPDDLHIILQLGTVQGWLGRHDDALATFRRGLALEPDNTELLLGYGRVLAWSGQLPQAEAVFRRCIAANPGDLDASNMLARVLNWQRQFDAAEDAYAGILIAAPDNTDALIGAGDVHRMRERFAEARDCYERALAVEPGSADIQQRLDSVRRVGAWRLDFGWEYSTFDGGVRDDWHGWDAALRYAVDRRTGVSLALEHARRFGFTDQQCTLGLDRRFDDTKSGYLRLSATPRADFFARQMLAVGGAWQVRRGDERLLSTTLLADLRLASYAPGTARSHWVGLTQNLDHRVALTGKALLTRNLNGRSTGGWLLRLDGEPSENWRWNLGCADSTESLASTVQDFSRELRTRAVFGGIARDFSLVRGIRLDLTRERTEGGLVRHAIHVGVYVRF